MKLYIFFWSAGWREGMKACLSQWYVSPFIAENITFPTCEHWMMYKKAMLFGDHVIAQRVLKTESPADVKKLGRRVKGFDEAKWCQHRFEIVVTGNYYKFSQNSLIGTWLISTTEHLVEASPYDKIWGIGMATDDCNIQDETKWKGLNLLGEALMVVRQRLIEENNYVSK